MPSVEENKAAWDDEYPWEQQGDEWSRAWGGVHMQWYGAILPRIKTFVPTGTILEIAPGFGRWTQFLKELCNTLIAVDLSEKAIEACRQRFAADPQVSLHVNDGKSLAMVPDRSIDFAFSFDSLVHVDADVIHAYLTQLSTKLTPDGIAFLHHSNLGEYASYYRVVHKMPPPGRPYLKKAGIEHRTHWRAFNMSAATFRSLAQAANLVCISQEIIGWGGTHRLIDTISIVTQPGSRWSRPIRVLRNEDFVRDVSVLARLAPLYSPDSFTSRAR
jgi:SAM-dependent methyltransferase